MKRELIEIFCTCYLYSSFFLLPVYSYYFIIDSKRFSPLLMNRIHKWVLLVTIIIPLLFTVLMFIGGPEESSAIKDLLYSKHSINDVVEKNQNRAMDDNNVFLYSNSMETIQAYHQIAWGAFYYLIDILAGLIVAGFMVFLFRFFIQKFYIAHIKHRGLETKEFLDYTIIISDRISLPFSTGLRNPDIYLPVGMNQDMADIVIRHELNHFKKNHQFWSFLESVLFHLFWFNPVSRLLHRRGVVLREMECDEVTIQTIDKYIYSKALLNTAESLQSSDRFGLMVQRWIQKGMLKRRLEQMLNNKKYKKLRFISIGFFAVLSISIGFLVFITLLDDDSLEKNIVKKVNSQYTSVIQTRNCIAFEDVPSHLIRILIFNEDKGFYDHDGVSGKAFLRAFLNNLFGGPLQGGSTITQQLSKMLCIQNPERTISRKLKQVKAARVLEKHFTKEKIMEMYLNSAYFGQGAFGVEKASRKFFNHPASELNMEKAAMLVQCLGSPKAYNYIDSPEIAKKRTVNLLTRMIDDDLLDKNQGDQSILKLRNNF